MFAIPCLLREKVADVRSPDISKYNLNGKFSLIKSMSLVCNCCFS